MRMISSFNNVVMNNYDNFNGRLGISELWWILLSVLPYLGGFIILILLIMPFKPTGERFGPYTDNPDA